MGFNCILFDFSWFPVLIKCAGFLSYNFTSIRIVLAFLYFILRAIRLKITNLVFSLVLAILVIGIGNIFYSALRTVQVVICILLTHHLSILKSRLKFVCQNFLAINNLIAFFGNKCLAIISQTINSLLISFNSCIN